MAIATAGTIGMNSTASSVATTDELLIKNGNSLKKATAQTVARGALGITVAEVTLTSAQILALNATPISVVTAPGAGLCIIVRSVYATKAAGTAYAGVAAGEDIALKYTNSSGSVCATLEMTGFADSASATQTYSPGAATLPVANAAIVAHMLTGEIITGTSDFKLRIEYEVRPVPAF